MSPVALSRLTTALAVGTVGGVAGHLLFPFSPGAGPLRPTLFVALVLATGALRGWREAVVRAAWQGRPAAGLGRAALLYALGALALALLGYVAFHGLPG